MIAFNLESGADVAEEIAKSVSRHVSEMKDANDYGAPSIDWEYYLQMSTAGLCKAVTMRDSGRLVGYAILMLSNNPRHKERIEAMCDGLFIEKEYRGKNTAEFMSALKKYTAQSGVSEVNILVGEPSVCRFLAANGFMETKKLWSLKNE